MDRIHVEEPRAPRVRSKQSAGRVGRIVLVGDAGVRIGNESDDILKEVNALLGCDEKGRPRAAMAGRAMARTSVIRAFRRAAESLARREAILRPLTEDVKEMPGTRVLFLGDNVYTHGITPGRETFQAFVDPATGCIPPAAGNNVDFKGLAALLAQVRVACQAGQGGIFVPGNHDWNSILDFAADGAERIRAQARAIGCIRQLIGEESITCSSTLPERAYPQCPAQVLLLPENATVGPAVTTLPLASGSRVVIVALDTEAILQAPLPTQEDGKCPSEVPEAKVFHDVAREVAQGGPNVIVIAHHPLESFGPHGGHDPRSLWTRLIAALRRFHGSPQDQSGIRNRWMVRNLRCALAPVDPSRFVAQAAGHEHVLHVTRGSLTEPWQLTSGSASKRSPVVRGPGPDIRSSMNGYMLLDFYDDGEVVLELVEVSKYKPIRRRFQLRDVM